MAGTFIAIELKTDVGILDELQEYNLRRIATCGGVALIITPRNFGECAMFLESIARELEPSLVSNEIMGDI